MSLYDIYVGIVPETNGTSIKLSLNAWTTDVWTSRLNSLATVATVTVSMENNEGVSEKNEYRKLVNTG